MRCVNRHKRVVEFFSFCFISVAKLHLELVGGVCLVVGSLSERSYIANEKIIINYNLGPGAGSDICAHPNSEYLDAEGIYASNPVQSVFNQFLAVSFAVGD